jgi:glucose-1-phosphate thymidylyltransferase
MKGIILAGGTGSRLHPLTKVTNKHLLPVYDKPMIYYPIETLVEAGIRDIMIVTGGKNAGDFLRLLGNGREFGLAHINYTYQEGEGGIAAALSLAEYFANKEKICVILGDNIIEMNISAAVRAFEKQESGAKILLKEVPDPQRFGVAEVIDGKIIGIEEIEELNIGHSIISRAVFVGIERAVREMVEAARAVRRSGADCFRENFAGIISREYFH